MNEIGEKEPREKLRLRDLCLVRIMPQPPRVVGGEIVLSTAFQSTRDRRDGAGKLIQNSDAAYRTTLHFSLNSPVENFAGGANWSSSRYGVISSLKATVDANRGGANLENLLGADTYFDVDPDETFVLPKGSLLIMPSTAKVSEDDESKPDYIVTYQVKDYTPTEAGELIKQNSSDQYSDTTEFHFIENEEMRRYIFDFRRQKNLGLLPPFDDIFEPFGQLTSGFKQHLLDKEGGYKLYLKILNEICNNIVFRNCIKQNILRMGFKIYESQSDRFLDTDANNDVEKIAAELGVDSQRHYLSHHNDLEEILQNLSAASYENRAQIEEQIWINWDKWTESEKKMLKHLGISERNHQL